MTMLTKKTCLLALLIMSFLGLFSQISSAPDTKSDVKYEKARQIFSMLYNANLDASDYILWDDIYVNDEDVTELYYESLEYGDNEVFMNEMVIAISKLLHYKGDSKDKYTDWNFTYESDDLIVRCRNKKKEVVMTFSTGNNDKLYLCDILVKDRK